MLDAGWVVRQKHPEAPLYIYNYTAGAQYERVWNDTTLACRGLILDEDYRVVARPFAKFFNYEEHQPETLPQEPFEVFEKMDGSLGILYFWEGSARIATRGSFDSEQARVANEMLHGQYAQALPHLCPAHTYLFEIIYPENRIVVDYGAAHMLVLLAVVNTATGAELPLPDIGFPVVARYDGMTDVQAIRQLHEDNREGFVLRYQSGLRVKIKFAEYVRLHRTITQMSSIKIWEHLCDRQPLEALLEDVPDEFYQWVHRRRDALLQAFEAIEAQARSEYKVLDDRKATAAYFLRCTHPKILFLMLDGRDYSAIIWQMIRPPFEKPFSL